MKNISGWSKIRLGDIVRVQGGFAFKSNDFQDEGIPIVRMSDLNNGSLNLNDSARIKAEKLKFFTDFELKDGDFLVGMSGSINNFAIVQEQDLPAYLNQRVGRFELRNKNGVDYKYITQVARSASYRQYIQLVAAGAAQVNISTSQIEDFEFDLPIIAEQAKIAEILETADQNIEQTEALIAKQKRIKTGLMQDLLTKGIDEQGNIRSEDTHEFKDSPLGRIPVEWEVYKIDDLATHVSSGVTPKGGESVYQNDGILFIRSQNVHFRGLKLNDVAYISEEIHRSMKRSEVFENDVLLNITGASIGRCCYMPNFNCKANTNQHVCTIRLKEANSCDAGYLSYVIESSIGQNQILQFNAGGNREGLNYQQVRSFQIPWAKDDERLRIFTIINSLNETIETLNSELNKQYRLKTALLQDLITGKKRVIPLLNDTGVIS